MLESASQTSTSKGDATINMATTTDDGFHEINLNGKQLVFLFMAVTVVSVVIFLLGVLVGREVRGGSPMEAVAELSGLPAAPDPGAAPPVASNGAPATANEPLSYPDRLSRPDNAPEKLREGNAPRSTPAAPPAAAATPAPATTKPAPVETKPVETKPAPAETRAAEVKPTPAPPAARPAADTKASSEPAGAGFAIQVAALKERNEADTIVKRLSGKGYAAYVVAPSPGTPSMYRVRVGKFKERREADAVAARLQKEEQFKPWIVR